MSFTENLKKAVDEAVTGVGKFGSQVTDKSKKFAAKTKLKNQISTEKRAIDGICLTVGKLSYEASKAGEEKDFSDFFTQIDEHKTKIEELNAQIAAIDGLDYCTGCGKPISRSDKFCNNCGTPNPNFGQTDAPTEEKEEAPKADPVTEADADVYVSDEEDEAKADETAAKAPSDQTAEN